MEQSFEPIEYNKMYEPLLIEFLEKCLPESGRALDINGGIVSIGISKTILKFLVHV